MVIFLVSEACAVPLVSVVNFRRSLNVKYSFGTQGILSRDLEILHKTG